MHNYVWIYGISSSEQPTTGFTKRYTLYVSTITVVFAIDIPTRKDIFKTDSKTVCNCSFTQVVAEQIFIFM